MRKYPYCFCGEEDVPGHHHIPGMCIDPDCWVGKTMVGWPHKISDCQKKTEDMSKKERKMVVIEEVLALKLRMGMTQKWDERFLQVAQLISTWSKDPSTKNGAIAVSSNRRILSQGYNGFPAGAKDDERLNDRKPKYQMVVHAESNVIYNACNFGISLNLSTIYLFGTYPCPECIKALGQVGIGRLVFQLGPSSNKKKWEWDFNLSKAILHELSIGFTHYKSIEKNWDVDDYPLPDWAIRKSDGNYMEVGAQLATRDGRRHGNAFVEHIETTPTFGDEAIIITDIGNKMRLNLNELKELFFPPMYIMDVNEAWKRRVRNGD